MNSSDTFINSIDSVQRKEVPETVLKRAKQALLDYIAVTTAGAKFQDEKIKKYLAFAQPEQGDFTVIGTKETLAMKEAVFLNGLNGHALDFDDGTNSGIIHLGAPVFSLLLPLAQRFDVRLGAMLKAAVIGYETSYTMAVTIQPGHKALGFHATGTCGVLGAAVAASYMLDFSEEERRNAFAAACVSATGMLKVLDDGSELKPYNVAKSALLALTSIQLAKAGFKGHPDPLGGERGYLKMMTGKEHTELKPALLNGTYAIQKTYIKPYASCRYTHPSIEAAIYLRNKYGLSAQDVEQIYISTYSLAVGGHDHTDIKGPYSAKMSIPYSVAAGFISGRAGLQEFSGDRVCDREYLDLAKKIEVIADQELSDAFPAVQAAVVNLKTTDGRVLVHRIDFPKGEPENPLDEDEFRLRYNGLMEYAGIKCAVGARLFDAVYGEDGPVGDILKLFDTGRCGG